MTISVALPEFEFGDCSESSVSATGRSVIDSAASEPDAAIKAKEIHTAFGIVGETDMRTVSYYDGSCAKMFPDMIELETAPGFRQMSARQKASVSETGRVRKHFTDEKAAMVCSYGCPGGGRREPAAA